MKANSYQTTLSLNEEETARFKRLKGFDKRYRIKTIFKIGMATIDKCIETENTKRLEKLL